MKTAPNNNDLLKATVQRGDFALTPENIKISDLRDALDLKLIGKTLNPLFKDEQFPAFKSKAFRVEPDETRIFDPRLEQLWGVALEPIKPNPKKPKEEKPKSSIFGTTFFS